MSDHDDELHVVPVRYYVYNICALLVLLILTVYAAFIDFGEAAGVAVMLTIAIVKMVLVLLVFMNVLWSSKLAQTFAATAFVWLLFMFGFTFADYLSRDDLTALKEGELRTPVHAEHHDGDHAADGHGEAGDHDESHDDSSH